jgi:hypothetical protein
MWENGYTSRISQKALIDCVKGTEESNPIDCAEPGPEAPYPERVNHKLDEQVPNKMYVMFSNVVEIIPHRSLKKSPSKHDLRQVPQVETAHVDFDKTN